mmetsp:Transcript_27806/g.82905  ORF Transcript_27806/g.82905 Transcript_27806/m.82905 type:complete len:287 (-) Transcript_27806:26-886(-)
MSTMSVVRSMRQARARARRALVCQAGEAAMVVLPDLRVEGGGGRRDIGSRWAYTARAGTPGPGLALGRCLEPLGRGPLPAHERELAALHAGHLRSRRLQVQGLRGGAAQQRHVRGEVEDVGRPGGAALVHLRVDVPQGHHVDVAPAGPLLEVGQVLVALRQLRLHLPVVLALISQRHHLLLQRGDHASALRQLVGLLDGVHRAQQRVVRREHGAQRRHARAEELLRVLHGQDAHGAGEGSHRRVSAARRGQRLGVRGLQVQEEPHDVRCGCVGVPRQVCLYAQSAY